jgi:virginiamycin B lyase
MINEFPIPTANRRPLGITAGPDGNLWFTEANGNLKLIITDNHPIFYKNA